MRLYKITASFYNAEGSLTVSKKFVGTQSEAAAARKEFMALGAKRKEVESVENDVPTDKAGLLAFLNDLVR